MAFIELPLPNPLVVKSVQINMNKHDVQGAEALLLASSVSPALSLHAKGTGEHGHFLLKPLGLCCLLAGLGSMRTDGKNVLLKLWYLSGSRFQGYVV